MTALVAASAVRTCHGDGAQTFEALLEGVDGSDALRYLDPAKINVGRGYYIEAATHERPFQASAWLTTCVRDALLAAGVEPGRQRVSAVVGSGLRELRGVERAAVDGDSCSADQLHFAAAVRAAAPGIADVVTISNACSAGSHALALAQDLIDLGEADVAVAAATDSITESMLAMIGRVSDRPTGALRPFDRRRTGTLLGEGAAAVVLVSEGACERPLARLLATGLSCDAHHETAAHEEGIRRAIDAAFERGRRTPADVDLLVAHGTATALNDPIESRLIRRLFADRNPQPLVTAVKGSVGHTSGTAGLINFDVAVRCLQRAVIPPIAGLEQPLDEGSGVRFVVGKPVHAQLRLAQVHAFGFGGVNAVTLVEAA